MFKLIAALWQAATLLCSCSYLGNASFAPGNRQETAFPRNRLPLKANLHQETALPRRCQLKTFKFQDLFKNLWYDHVTTFTTFQYMSHNVLMWQEPTQFKCAVFIRWIHRFETRVNKHLVFCLEPNSNAGQEEEARIIEAITFSRQASQSPASQYLFWNLTFKIFVWQGNESFDLQRRMTIYLE